MSDNVGDVGVVEAGVTGRLVPMMGDLVFVLLWVYGVYWCYTVTRRLPDDIREFRRVKETIRRGVIIFIWLFTIVIAAVVISVTSPALRRIFLVIRDLL